MSAAEHGLNGDAARTRRTWILLAALVAALGLRFVRLEMDAPYGILSHSGEFLTDEGWYTKSALLRVKTGAWSSEYDMVWFTYNSLFTLIETAAFRLLGVSVHTARLVSVVASCVSVAAFYAILRTVQSRGWALATCLLTAVTLHTFAYSRMALIEPTGVALSMVALAAWVLLPRGGAACWTGLLVAAAACFVKLSFLFTLCVLAALAIGEAVVLLRARRRAAAAVVLAAVVAVPLAAWVAQSWVAGIAPEQAERFERWHVASRIHEVAVGGAVVNEIKMLFKLVFQHGALALVAVIAALGPLVAVRTRGHGLLPRSPAAIALALWGVGGVAFFGLFDYQPPRYFYFAIFPLAFGAVAVLRLALPPARHAAAVAALLGLHAAVQVPGYLEWLSRDDLMSSDRAIRDAVAHMDLGSAKDPVFVIGGPAAFVALYDDRLLPIDYRFHNKLARRVERWRPQYLFTPPTSAYHMPLDCPGLVDRLDLVASYRYLGNYYTFEDHALYRVVYAR